LHSGLDGNRACLVRGSQDNGGASVRASGRLARTERRRLHDELLRGDLEGHGDVGGGHTGAELDQRSDAGLVDAVGLMTRADLTIAGHDAGQLRALYVDGELEGQRGAIRIVAVLVCGEHTNGPR